MKKIASTLLLLSCFVTVMAQDKKPLPASAATSSDFHAHQGFHFEFGIGPVFGTIDDKATGTFNGITLPASIQFSGTGFGLDMKIGGAVEDNLILTFDILSKSIVGPTLTVNGISGSANNDYSIGEVTYGGGLTYYMMPSDIFFSGTIGAGAFVSNDMKHNITTRSDYGFSFQLKAGKHWWISTRWGISLSAAYGSTSASDKGTDVNGPYSDDFTSNRFTIGASIGVH